MPHWKQNLCQHLGISNNRDNRRALNYALRREPGGEYLLDLLGVLLHVHPDKAHREKLSLAIIKARELCQLTIESMEQNVIDRYSDPIDSSPAEVEQR